MPSFLSGICLFRFHLIPADAEELLEKSLQLLDDGLLLFGAGTTAAKTGDRRHQFVDVGAGGLDLPVPESVLQELAGFRLAELFFLDQLLQRLFALGTDITVPLGHHIIHIVDARNKVLDQALFAAQFGAGIHGAADGNEHFFVVAMGIVVLLHQHEDVIDVDLDLADKFHLKDDVVGDVLFVALASLQPLVPQILVPAQIVLQIPLLQQFLAGKLIERGEQVAHAQNGAEQRNKLFLVLLAHNAGFRERELGGQFLDHIHIAGLVLAVGGGITIVIIPELAQQHDAAGVFVAKQGDGRIHPLLQIAETDDIAEGLDRIQDAVGAAERLDQPVHFQVFIHPQGVQGGGVKAGEEHIHHDEQIQFLVFHPQGNVLVVVLELVAVGGIVGAEHLVVVPDGSVQKIPAALIQAGGVRAVFLVQDAVCFALVGAVAVNDGHSQLFGGVCGHLLLEFLVVPLGQVHRSHRKNRVEPAEALGLLDFRHGVLLAAGHFGDVGQGVEPVEPLAAVGFLVEVVQNVLGYQLHPLGSHEGFFPVDIPDGFVVNVRLLLHRLDVVHPEGQHVVVVNGIHDGVGVERPHRVALFVRFPAEKLSGGFHTALAAGWGVDRKDGGAGEAEQMILFEVGDHGLVHIPKLAAVTFVKDHHHMALVDRMSGIFLDEGGQLLDGGDDDAGVGGLQLAFEHGGGGVAVGGALLEAVVFLHGLVVQVLAVHHKENLVYVGQLAGQTGGLEGGQRLAAAGGVPDVAAAPLGAVGFVVVGNGDAVEDALGGGDLVGPHDHEHILGGEDAVPGQDVEQSVPGKEGAGKVHQIGQDLVLCVRPEGGELEAVAGLGLFVAAGLSLADGIEPGGVGVVLDVGAVGDDEDLHILKQAAARPEGVPLVAVDLVEGFPDGHAPALEFHMDQGQTVDQNGHVIAVVVAGALVPADGVLVDDLQPVVVDVFLVQQGDVFGSAVVPAQHLDEILLHLAGLFHNVFVGVGQRLVEKAVPLAVCKGVVVEGFQLTAQVGDEFRLGVDRQIGIALLGELLDERLFQRGLALVAVRPGGTGFIGGDHRVLGGGSNDVIGVHGRSPPSKYS